MKKNILLLLFFCVSLTSSAQLNMLFRDSIFYGTSNELANIGGYVDSTGREYALVGCQLGLSIVDVTNPDSVFQKILIPGVNSFWREVKVWGKYAYVTCENGTSGLRIINLGKLPGTITASDYKYWRGTGPILNALNRSHSLHIDNGYLYLNGSNGSALFGGATCIISLADPWNPVYVGNTQMALTGTNRYVHDCYVRNDTMWGAHIYGGFFSIINVANKATPVLIATQFTPGAFTHNTWLNTSGTRTVFTTDEVGDSRMTSYNVSNVGNITESDWVQHNMGSNAIVHNTHILNNYAIVSWYKEGVAIVDVSRPDNMIVTGYYDTYPQGSGYGFNGCWGVYPFLPSGKIVASDINNGLVVLTPTYVRGCYLEGVITDTCTNIPVPFVTITISGTTYAEPGRTNGVYKTGTATAGTYSVTFTNPNYETKTIHGVVLNNGVLTNLDVKLKPINAVAITGSAVTNVTCNGGSNGAINVSATGGGLPYTWLWNGGQTTEDRNALTAGTYTVTVTDAAGCKSSAVYNVSQPSPITVNFTSTPVTCTDNNDGSITAYISGGTLPYTIDWDYPISNRLASNLKLDLTRRPLSDDTTTIVNLFPGGYTLNITDANGCIASFPYNLTNPLNPCLFTLNVRLFVEGFYQPGQTMSPVVDALNQPLLADTFIVQLASSVSPHSIVYSDTARVSTNGWGSFNFPAGCWMNNYYIVIRHRNSIETWSKVPVLFDAATKSFDFTN